MPHRYEYTLDLLRQTVAKAPKFFSAERRAAMEEELRRLAADSRATQQTIEDRIIAFGREIYPHRKSFYRIHDTEGRPREQEKIRAALEPALRAKFEAFLRGGGRVEDVRRGGDFEQYFSPEEKAAITASKLAAHDAVVAEIETLCVGEKRSACETHLGEYTKEQEEIGRLIGALRAIGSRSERWEAEIRDKVRTFELGWSGVEHEVSADAVRAEIDYYQGVIDESAEMR